MSENVDPRWSILLDDGTTYVGCYDSEEEERGDVIEYRLDGPQSLLLLQHTAWAVALSLAFGLIGAAPAGIIMSLTAQSMAPQRRAFGMGVFFSFYFVLMTTGPPIAGWLFDRTQGLMVKPGNPKKLVRLADLAQVDMLFTDAPAPPAVTPTSR